MVEVAKYNLVGKPASVIVQVIQSIDSKNGLRRTARL